MSTVLEIEGEAKTFLGLSYDNILEWGRMTQFAAELLPEDSAETGDAVKIFRGGVLDWEGQVEKIYRGISGSGGRRLKVSGRDLKVKFFERDTGVNIFLEADAKTLIKYLVTPLTQLEFVIGTKYERWFNPDIEGFEDQTSINRAYPDNTRTQDEWVELSIPPSPGTSHYCIQTEVEGGGEDRDSRHFFKFTLPVTCNAGYVTSAYFRWWKIDAENIGGLTEAYQEFHQINEKFVFDDVTWNAQPGYDAGEFGKTLIAVGDGWKEYNVTTAMIALLNGSKKNYGWVLRHTDEDPGAGKWLAIYFYRNNQCHYHADVLPHLEINTTTNPNLLYAVATSNKNNSYTYRALKEMSNRPWSSEANQENGDYFKLDLGAVHQVASIYFEHEEGYHPRHWKLEVSANGADWTEVKSKSDCSLRVLTFLFDAVSARYVRLSLTAGFAAHWRISDIKIYESIEDPVIPIGEIKDPGITTSWRWDSQDRLGALANLLSMLTWEAWVEDGKFYCDIERGENKSAEVKFEEGEHFTSVERRTERTIANTLISIGHGYGADMIWTTSINEELRAKEGVREFVFSLPKENIDWDLMCYWNMQALPYLIKYGYISPFIGFELLDSYEPGSWGVGDHVQLASSTLGFDEQSRVITVSRAVDHEGEAAKVFCEKYPTDISEILRRVGWQIEKLGKIPQSSTAKLEED